MAEIAKAAVKWGKTSWVGRLSFRVSVSHAKRF